MIARAALTALATALACAGTAQAAYLTAPNTQVQQAVTEANVRVLGQPMTTVQGNLFTATSDALNGAAADSGPSPAPAPQATSTATLRPVESCATYLTAQLMTTCLTS